ncbi:MAG: hypothetical protein CMJ46_01180 [Planctomyces sp.]|nr:hypothetical protein [Planctomyces sp.]
MNRRTLLIEDEHQIYANPPAWEVVREADGSIVVRETKKFYVRRQVLLVLSILLFITIWCAAVFTPQLALQAPVWGMTPFIIALTCSIPFLVFWHRFVLITKATYRDLGKAEPVIFELNRARELRFPRKKIDVLAPRHGIIEIVHDYRAEYFLYSPDQVNHLAPQRIHPWVYPVTEVNVIVEEEVGNWRRYPIAGQIKSAKEIFPLAVLLHQRLGWPVRLRIGDAIEEKDRQHLETFAESRIVPIETLNMPAAADVVSPGHRKLEELAARERYGTRVENERQESKKARILIGMMGVLFLIAVILTLDEVIETIRTFRWPVAQGTVTFSAVDPRLAGSFDLDVRYEFQVQANRHTGHRVAVVAEVYDTKQEALQKLRKYPMQGQVTVYFDPDDPSQSVLERGGVWAALVHNAQPILFFLSTITMWWAISRSQKRFVDNH